ncbi:MAG: polymer-forming cytoskeletal protein [Desulfobacterales bacterium]|jgi:cytoskeletal protein CcmA (bactofilin family)
MKSKKRGRKVDSISTFLGSKASVDGTIEFEGTIRLDGSVKGKIKSSGGTVIVGEKAVVDAEIIVGTAIIMGQVQGTIDAEERIEVYPPGRVVGDIQAPVISIEEGGLFNGNCAMKNTAAVSKTKVTPLQEATAIDTSKRQ